MIVLSLYTVLITQRETVEKIYAVNQYLTEDRLKEAFNKKLLSKQKEQYNSYKNLSMQKLSLFFNTIETDLSILETEYTQHSSITQNLQLIKNAITEEKNKILEYQIKYGSDDNDETRKSKYLNIINNFECLYSTTC